MVFRKLLSLLIISFTSLLVSAQSAENKDITKVYLVFKTHLDIGFTELSSKVIDTYNREFIPSALALSEELSKGENEGTTYPWTTGSWLIWNYLQNASGNNRQRMEKAIQRGDFWWHAMPFTLQTELCDSSLLSTALMLSENLDKRFGRKTIAVKITDVPGVTRSIIPILKRHGIHLLHLGANPGAAIAKLPEVFRWRDVSGEEINVIYQSDYGKPLQIPGTSAIAELSFTHDNHGPHSKEAIKKIYSDLKQKYPNAKIIAGSLNDIARELDSVSGNFPVVTQEWGDTWSYGIASDPKKIADFRQLIRLRKQWIDRGILLPGSDLDLNFSIPLLLVTEHTWGVDVKSYIKNYDKYEFDKYPEFLENPEARYAEQSWNEKRTYIFESIAALPADLQREAIESLNELTPKEPSAIEYKSVLSSKKMIETTYFQLSLDGRTGAINRLKNKRSGRMIADENHLLGELAYQTYSAADFTHFIKLYCPENPSWWMQADYGKPQLDKLVVENKIWKYKVSDIRVGKEKEFTKVIVSLLSGEAPYGMPRKAFIEYIFPNDKPEIQIELTWMDKNKNRIPEAIWFSFQPLLPEDSKAHVDKLGTKVDVQDVVYNGGRSIHGVTEAVFLGTAQDMFELHSLDAPLVQFDQRNLLNFDNREVNPENGVNVCLLNTLWGTNYPQWFGDDMKFRFVVAIN